MILKAKNKYNFNLKSSFMVGDTLNDIEARSNTGCKTVIVLTGYGREEQKKINETIPRFNSYKLIRIC